MSFRLLPVVVAIPVLALTIWTQAQESAPESTATSLLPEPAADKVASGVKTLKSLYASDYRRTQDNNKLQAQFGSLGLARKLLKTAAETPPDSDGYYPMLSEASRLATIGNKPDVAFDAIGRLLKTHAIDASAMRLKVLTHFGQRTTRLTDVRTASRFVMPAIQAAADAQKIKTAQALMAVGETMAKRMFDRTMQKALAQASELLELLRKQEEEVVAALKKIEQNPEDPVANLTVVSFMGLRKGDWEGAEFYAALVDEDDVRSLFVREFAAPEDIKEILRLANDWWEFAETQSGAVRLQATELAAIRYASIVKQLKGFEQKQVETRLAGVIRDHVVAVRMPVVIKADEPGSPQPPEWINDGLVAYYPFTGDATDKSGNGNDGIVQGASLAADRHGKQRASYQFDGRDDSILFNSVFPLNEIGARSLSFWLNVTSAKPKNSAAILWGRSSLTDDNRFHFWLDRGPEISIGFHIKNGRSTFIGKPITLTKSVWQFVSLTRSKDSYKVYVNGIPTIEYLDNYANLPSSTGWALAGRRRFFNGLIDDIRIYNRALSADEVKALYEFEKAD